MSTQQQNALEFIRTVKDSYFSCLVKDCLSRMYSTQEDAVLCTTFESSVVCFSNDSDGAEGFGRKRVLFGGEYMSFSDAHDSKTNYGCHSISCLNPYDTQIFASEGVRSGLDGI